MSGHRSGFNARGNNPYRIFRMSIAREQQAVDDCDVLSDHLYAMLDDDEYEQWIEDNIPDDASFLETKKILEEGINKFLNEPCTCGGSQQSPCLTCTRRQKLKEVEDAELKEILAHARDKKKVRVVTAKGVYWK